MLSSAAHPLKHRQGNSVMEQDGYKKTPPITTTKPNKRREYRVKGEVLPMLSALEADFFLSLPPSKIVFGCDPSQGCCDSSVSSS